MAEHAANVLGIFAKWPAPGRVKTRLGAATSPAWAAQVAGAFLRDTLERTKAVAARRLLAFEPADARDDFAALTNGTVELTPQGAGDLGGRMRAFFDVAFADGAERVAVIGTDSPTMPLERIEQTWQRLSEVDVVLGPATDGGYYLLGCARNTPHIFDGISWSGDRVLAETVERIERAGLRLALLEPWYDVDTLADWNMLRGHLHALLAAGAANEFPHTLGLADADST
jgi:uncharacterized protein